MMYQLEEIDELFDNPFVVSLRMDYYIILLRLRNGDFSLQLKKIGQKYVLLRDSVCKIRYF